MCRRGALPALPSHVRTLSPLPALESPKEKSAGNVFICLLNVGKNVRQNPFFTIGKNEKLRFGRSRDLPKQRDGGGGGGGATVVVIALVMMEMGVVALKPMPAGRGPSPGRVEAPVRRSPRLRPAQDPLALSVSSIIASGGGASGARGHAGRSRGKCRGRFHSPSTQHKTAAAGPAHARCAHARSRPRGALPDPD
jgi:hypothetical protein